MKKSDEGTCELTDINGIPLDDPRLRNIDPYLLERVHNEVLDRSPAVKWVDIGEISISFPPFLFLFSCSLGGGEI